MAFIAPPGTARRAGLSALFAALLVPTVLATSAQAETFGQACAATLLTHPSIMADDATVKAADEAVSTAQSAFFPSLTVTGEVNTDNYVRSSGPLDLFGRQLGVEASQLIFDGYIAAARIDAATAERDALAADRDTNVNTILLSVARAYIAVVRDRHLLAAAQHNLDEHHRSVSRLVGIVSLDAGKQFDLTQVRSREAYAVSVVEQSKAELVQSEAQYRELTGKPPGTLDMPRTLGGKGFSSLDNALSLALWEHPAVISNSYRVVERAANRRDAFGQSTPRVDLVARYVKGTDIAALPGQDDEAYAGVRASYAFQTGGGVQANVRNADLLQQAQVDKLAAAKRDVREAVRTAWAAREGLIRTLPSVEDSLKRSVEVVDGFKTQYTLGRRTILDLLIVQNDLFQADTREASLAADRVLADYTLAAEEGQLVARFATVTRPQPQARPEEHTTPVNLPNLPAHPPQHPGVGTTPGTPVHKR